jgi:large conductance mechanosensitive channel
MWNDFKAFAFKGNLIDLAVAVVLGVAFTSVITAIVNGLFMPLIGVISPGGTWQTWTVWKFEVGAVIAALLNFVIVAFVLFLVVQKVVKAIDRRPAIAPPPTATEVLLAEIRDLLARQGR